MARMTKQSAENVRIAEKAVIHQLAGGFGIEIWLRGNASWVSGSAGIIEFETVIKAEQAVKRINPDLLMIHKRAEKENE